MSLDLLKLYSARDLHMSMSEIGGIFVDALPKHLEDIRIPGRKISDEFRREAVLTRFEQSVEIQRMMREVLSHSITRDAEFYAEGAFKAFLQKDRVDAGVLKFFNGWNEIHKTTSLVSAKIIMRLSADALSVAPAQQAYYNQVLAHMHEVAKDDFGLGHKGHDGMYYYMTSAFGASGWAEDEYCVSECMDFSKFLYDTGVANYTCAMNSIEHRHSIMDAMMVSIASELWNGREYNFIAQYIERKLLESNVALSRDVKGLRNAKAYVMCHSGEVESKHGLHALAAAQIYGRAVGLSFNVERLKDRMLDYNGRVGNAFRSLGDALI